MRLTPRGFVNAGWESTLGALDFDNLTTAATECALDDQCSGVHDQGCFAHDTNKPIKRFRLCDKRVASSLHWSAPKPCIHAKPGDASHGEDWSAMIDGKWCSTWCCCEKSSHANTPPTTTAYRGVACDDKNECESQPCTNGAECSESGTDLHVSKPGSV